MKIDRQVTHYLWRFLVSIADMDVPFRSGDSLSGGEAVEPLRLRLQGLNLASFSAGVEPPPLQYALGWNDGLHSRWGKTFRVERKQIVQLVQLKKV